MPEIPPILLAALTGFISGLLLSIPVGPVNLTIMNEGARHGFLRAAMISLGATFMESIYCALAFTGFASFFERGLIKAAMELLSFVFMLFLGIKFLLAKTISAPTRLTPQTDEIEARIEKKLHPHSAFAIGFVRVMANPAILLFWIILAANFLSREWVEPTWAGKTACISGVAVGLLTWFMGVSYAVSFGHKKISEKTLLLMEHISGAALLLMAFFHGGRIIWQMAKLRM